MSTIELPRQGDGASVRTPARRAVRRSLAIAPAALAFALVWTVATVGLVLFSFWWREAGWTPRTEAVLSTFALGGAIGGLLAPLAAAAIAGHRPTGARFAAMFAGLIIATGGGTLLVYAIRFRLADPDFWVNFPSLIFIVELVFTMASAVYVLLVSGFPLLLPHGLIALLAAAAWFARRPRG